MAASTKLVEVTYQAMHAICKVFQLRTLPWIFFSAALTIPGYPYEREHYEAARYAAGNGHGMCGMRRIAAIILGTS